MPSIGIDGMEFLGSVKMPGSAATSAVLTIPAREMLIIQFNITGYTGSDIASLRFNGDTGSNYNTTFLTYSTAVPAAPTATITTNMIRLGANAVANQRNGQVTVYNFLGTAHPVTINSLTQSATGTAPTISVGGGNWNSAASTQVTSVQLVLQNASGMTAGTSFAVWGINP